jgi:ATP-dependent helicase/nuclease subunit A
VRADPSITAADPKLSAWVAANAGSGKTYTLANRVTRLLLDDAAPERILCLTYTKAAAAEMQTRLFEQLGRWAMLPDKELRKNIEEIGAIAGTAEDLKKARRLFAQALETPGGLKIQTIHAFCQNLLARFPLEAGVPPSFTVLDDQTARELMAEARARVLERAGSGDAPRHAAIARLVKATGEKQMRDQLDTLLGTDRRKLERFFARLDCPLEQAVHRTHGAGNLTTLGVAEEFAAEAHVERDSLREITAWMATGKKSDQERGAELAEALLTGPDSEMFLALRRALLTGKGEKYKDFVTKQFATTRRDLTSALEAFIDRFLAALDRYRAADAAEICHAVLVLADAARKEYDAAKRARGTLDYDDLIVETLALLKHKSAAQWVLYKLDGGLDHVLIDEAQDTGPEQWEIVKLLTGEFFAGAGARREGLSRTVFAVGDEKQSIFSFQGADPREFDLNRKYFLELARGAEQHLIEAPLIQSRRSAPEILSFVDAVFADEAARAGLTSSGSQIEHEAFRAKAKGRVELWPTFKPSKEEERDPWSEVDAVSEQSPIVKLAQKLAGTIADWIAKRVRLPDHEQPIRPGDIMILLPRREPFGPEIIKRLKERGVPVAGADRVQLTEQIAVMDLIALGRFALQPDDDLTLASLLRSPLCGLSEDELYALCHGRSGSVWSALSARREETPAFAAAHEFLAAMRARADFSPPFEFYSHALIARGLRAKLLSRLGVEANDVIDEFVSLSLAYENQNTPSLEGFLHWIETGGAEIKRDMERGRNEVRVMTVHGAKGLEADIVILPDTTSEPDPPWMKGHLLHGEDGVRYPYRNEDASEALRAAKDAAKAEMLKEHRRLLYVALTRAKDRLVVCGFENKRGIRENSWYRLCDAAAKKIGTAHLRGEETVYIVGDPGDQFGLALEKSSAPTGVPEWALSPPVAETPRPRFIRPSDASDALEPSVLSPLDQGGAKRFRRGLLVHSLLARLPDLAAEKRREAALAFLRAREVAEDEAIALTEETLAVLDDPKFAPAFAPASMAEAAIVASLPELGEAARVNGRIDRLAVSDDEVLIVDFKTNRPPPEKAEDVGELYLAQMALYQAAARKIFPKRRIACALVWTDGPRLMPLDEPLLEAQLRRIRARLDPSPPRS